MPKKRTPHINGCKVCSKCKTDKPLGEYWKNSATWDGLACHCKDCAKAIIAVYRNTPEFKERDRARHRGEKFTRYTYEFRNRPEEKEKSRLRTQDAILSGKKNESWKRDKERHPERHAARTALMHEIERGRIQPAKNCECSAKSDGKCSGRIEYHHHNGYEKEHWLDVVPLCKYHHGVERRKYK